MKGTDHFKKAIESYLQAIAKKDPLFAKTLEKENKNIDDCITYILNTVKKSECNGYADAEIYGMALHYYDEDNIKVGDKIQGDIIVNHEVKLTEEEILKLKEKARQEVIDAEKQRLTKKTTSDAYTGKSKKKEDAPQQSLF